MFALLALIIGFLCALTSRAMLVVAAFTVSFWWGLGIFLPFGPAIFRHTYPDQSHWSKKVGFATLPCFALYIALGGFSPMTQTSPNRFSIMDPSPLVAYAKENKAPTSRTQKAAPAPAPTATPSLEARRAANVKEFEGLRKWGDALRLRKRDLLRSDIEGNRAYDADLALYENALAKATVERNAIFPAVK
jgi:hypothetical protein